MIELSMRWILLLVITILGALSGTLAADEAPPDTPAPPTLASRHQAWLIEVEPLIQPAEREVFLALTKDYQRDSFIQRFWRARDPFPETSRNEFRDHWEANRKIALDLYGTLEDPRAEMLLFNGEPASKQEYRCSDLLFPLEVWYYNGTPQIRARFYLVFYRRGGAKGPPYRLWEPSRGLDPLFSSAFVRVSSEQAGAALIAQECLQGGLILEALTGALEWDDVLARQPVIPKPGEEWLRTFVAYSTDVPEAAEAFAAQVEIDFPGRFQSRTLVQGLVSVPESEVVLSDLEQHPSYNFVLDGEILRRDELFEHFRYRFNLTPSQVQEGLLPLAFQRLLRPGLYQLVLKVEDLNGKAFFSHAQDLDVPRVKDSPPTSEPATALTASAASGDPASASPTAATPLSTRLLQEANADLPTGDYTVKLMAPMDRLMTGRLRVEALVQGEGVERVLFELNGRPVFTKSRPPYSVELNLGEVPKIHTLRAVALDAGERVLAADEILVNAGPHRFAVRLIEPQAGRSYARSLRAQAVVDLPEGERLDRLEFFLNDTLVATLYQPPFVQPLLIAGDAPLSFVRAVAYLKEGGSAEDAVFVNAPDFVDQVKVQFVELFTTTLGRRGQPVEDLLPEEVEVLENDVPQTLLRFERVHDVPIHAGILLDVSNSMTTRLDQTVKGALRFFETVLTPKDRAAVITFNETPHLAVRFTNSLEVLAGGLVGLTAEGETSLYDSLIYSLYYFSGIRGKRTIILLSDGEDVRSRYGFEDVIEYARRTGVAIYAVGINLPGGKNDIRLKLQSLSSETGGTSFFINDSHDLAKVYTAIEQELRSQYVLSYQSTNTGEGFRRIEVKVKRPGVSAKALSGYYP
jgi:Ca-activated chloride channel family protein